MDEVVRKARKVTWVGFWVNAVLGVCKVIAGIVGHSVAMVTDGIHSFSDFISDIIVILFIGISRRKADSDHQYGHGKYETFATMLLSVLLGCVGIGFFIDGAEQCYMALNGQELARPGWIALVMAVISIGAKEWLFRYTRMVGRQISSSLIIANAWHHRSDAMSSLATVVGVAGAMFLGTQWRILDPLAAIVISVFIIITAVEIGKPAIKELLEISLPRDTVNKMYKIIGHTPGVKAFHQFASRSNGYVKIVDFHIKVDAEITVAQAHAIADNVEHRLKESFGKEMRVNVHIEPYQGQAVDENNMCK